MSKTAALPSSAPKLAAMSRMKDRLVLVLNLGLTYPRRWTKHGLVIKCCLCVSNKNTQFLNKGSLKLMRSNLSFLILIQRLWFRFQNKIQNRQSECKRWLKWSFIMELKMELISQHPFTPNSWSSFSILTLNANKLCSIASVLQLWDEKTRMSCSCSKSKKPDSIIRSTFLY